MEPTAGVRVPTEAAPWPDTERRSIAGVSGFGITGTNAHVVLQGVELDSGRLATQAADRPLLFVLSAQTREALRAVATSWIERMDSDPAWPSSLPDLAYTAAVRRTHLDHRVAVAASTRAELHARLAAWLDDDEQPGVVSGRGLSLRSTGAVFVYPGQGGQWLGMGRTLLEREPVFREMMQRCDAAIVRHVGWSVIDELRAAPNASRLDEIDVVQPTLFSVMIALTELQAFPRSRAVGSRWAQHG